MGAATVASVARPPQPQPLPFSPPLPALSPQVMFALRMGQVEHLATCDTDGMPSATAELERLRRQLAAASGPSADHGAGGGAQAGGGVWRYQWMALPLAEAAIVLLTAAILKPSE